MSAGTEHDVVATAPTSSTTKAAISPVGVGAVTITHQIYPVLDELLEAAQLDTSYTVALHTVLAEACASEQAGFPLAALPLLACQAAGGDPHAALPVAATWRALHIALKLLDDVEDGDVARLSASPLATARVTNLSTGFLALAPVALASLSPAAYIDVQMDIQRTLMRMAGGQHAGFNGLNGLDLDMYQAIMAAKSGIFFGLAARSGARCATDDVASLQLLERFGHAVGMLIQVADDRADFRQIGSAGDLAAGQPSLAVYYALQVVPSTNQERLGMLLAGAATDPIAEQAARETIQALGAESYLQFEAFRHRGAALDALATAHRQGMDVGPLHRWLAALEHAIW